MLGRKHSIETRAKISQALQSEVTKAKLSKSSRKWAAENVNPVSKMWKVVDPTGKVYIIEGLNKLCQEYNLCHSAMYRVAKGERKHHKRWRCEPF